MDKNQEFIIEKIKYGLLNKKPPEPFSQTDMERLGWDIEEYFNIPQEEWNEWSRKMHWALQVAIMDDTDTFKNSDKIYKWRTICTNIVQNMKESGRHLSILDNLVLHFLDKDLLHHVINIFGLKNLNEIEKELVEKFSGAEKFGSGKGCFGTVIAAITIILFMLIIFIFL